jgi:hypothetical protein
MRTNGLQPRAIGALSVVAASLFLALCLFNFGQVAAMDATAQAGFHLVIAGWFVEVFGAGAYVMVVLPFVWGLVVYFREATPSLTMRASGTLLLACSVAMISGLLQQPDPGLWAGAVGGYTVKLTQGLGSAFGAAIANTIAYTGSLALFVASLIWATDWMFHTLRKGDVGFDAGVRRPIETEPVRDELFVTETHEFGGNGEFDAGSFDAGDFDEGPAEREFVRMETPGAQAAAVLDQPSAATRPLEVPTVPAEFSSDDRGGRVIVRGPAGYDGVEFLPPSDELAGPEDRTPQYIDEHLPAPMLDDELTLEPETTSEARIPDTSETDVVIDVLPAAARVQEHEESPVTEDAPYAAVELDLFSSAPIYADAEQTEAPEIGTREETAPVETDRPRSGIGLPEDSPFVDEFFVMGGGAADEPAGTDGAAHHDDVEPAFATPTPGIESPEALASEPAPAETTPATDHGDPVIVDEVLFAPAAFDLIDDVISDEVPQAIAQRSAAPSAPQPQTEARSGPDLSRLSGMVLDPLFHDAVSAVIERGRASGMVLQRNFGIGHARGIRLLEQMAAAGIVGDEDADGSRALRVTREEWDAFTGSRTA